MKIGDTELIIQTLGKVPSSKRVKIAKRTGTLKHGDKDIINGQI